MLYIIIPGMEDCPYRDGAWKVLFITGFIQIKFSLFLFFISKKERIKMHIAYSFNGENSEINVRWTDSDGHSLIFFSIISEVCGRYGFNRELYQCIFRKNCASVPEERSAIPLQTEQSSAG